MADVDEEVKRGDVLTKHLYGLLCGLFYTLAVHFTANYVLILYVRTYVCVYIAW